MFSEFKKAYHELTEKNAKAFFLVRAWVLKKLVSSNDKRNASKVSYGQAKEEKGRIDNELMLWRTDLSHLVVEAQSKNKSFNQEIDHDLNDHRFQVIDPVINQSEASSKVAKAVLLHSEVVLRSLNEQNTRSRILKKSLVDTLAIKGDKHIELSGSLDPTVGEFGVSKERFAENASSFRKQISSGNSKIALSEKLLNEVEGLSDVE